MRADAAKNYGAWELLESCRRQELEATSCFPQLPEGSAVMTEFAEAPRALRRQRTTDLFSERERLQVKRRTLSRTEIPESFFSVVVVVEIMNATITQPAKQEGGELSGYF